MYKLIKDPRTNKVCAIELIGVNTSFSQDPANTDYQAFLKYKEEGNKVYGPDEEVPTGG